MATIDLSHRIRVSSSLSASGTGSTVVVADESKAIFAGDGAKGRAIEGPRSGSPTRFELSGTVLVVVESADGGEKVTRVVRSKLAS